MALHRADTQPVCVGVLIFKLDQSSYTTRITAMGAGSFLPGAPVDIREHQHPSVQCEVLALTPGGEMKPFPGLLPLLLMSYRCPHVPSCLW